MKLKTSNLSGLAQRLPVPAYDRARVRTGIVHLGVGGFHRSHQARYLDALFGKQLGHDFGITGVGLLPQDRAMRDALDDQDRLYTLVEKESDGSLRPRVIGSIIRYLYAPDDLERVLNELIDPSTRIVTLTITEGGYHVNQATGEFDPSDETIRRDLVRGSRPQTAFGLLTEALDRRREAGIAPFVVASCDNVPQNGELARRMLSAFARRKDPQLGDWIEREVPFPNSMVDRITPVTTDEDRTRLSQEFGVDDSWPVCCEPFSQWVVEDRFPTGRPPLEEVGVQFVDDVEPYERMKLRLLNSGHQAICYLGYLAGYRYADETCRDPLFVRFLEAYLDGEATSTLAPVAGVDLGEYKAQIVERFANPAISDSLVRLCADTSDRIPAFLLPVVHDRLRNGQDVRHSALIVASWARYAQGVDESGAPISVVDRRRDELMARAARHSEDPLAFLGDRSLFGDLGEDPRFTRPYLDALESLREVGARATVERWVADPDRS